MSQWPLVHLRDVLSLDCHEEAIDPTRTYPMAGVLSYGRGLFSRGPQDGASTSYRTFHKVIVDQVVLSQLKGWEGAIALATDEFRDLFLPPHNACFSVGKDADARYLFWFLRQPSVWDRLKASSRGMGARRDTVSAEDFLAIPMRLPPLAVQNRVVAQLDAATNRLGMLQIANSAAETDLVALLRASFDRTVDGAPRARMADLAPLVRRPIEIDLDGSYPELGIRSFGKGTFHKPPLGGVDVGTKRLFRIEEGDLLFNIVFAWEGAVAVAQPDDDGRFGSHRFLTCVPDRERATSNFIRYYFLTPEGLQKLGHASPGGAGRNRTLGLKALEAIDVPLPPLSAQLRFDALQAKAAAFRQLRASTAEETSYLVPSLLHRAFATLPTPLEA